jgi:hypothetical protein
MNLLFIIGVIIARTATAAFLQGDEAAYLALWPNLTATSYSTVAPLACLKARGVIHRGIRSRRVVVEVRLPRGVIRASDAAGAKCNYNVLCVVGGGTVLLLNRNFNVGALRVESGGSAIWVDSVQKKTQWLCAGYILVDGGVLDISAQRGRGMLYIKDNGFEVLSNASYGAFYKRFIGSINGGQISVRGRKMARTWSLLAAPSPQIHGAATLTLMHDAAAMGWQKGDRVVVASMAPLSQGTALQANIIELLGNTIVVQTLGGAASAASAAAKMFPVKTALSQSGTVVLQSPEVINLSRSVVITGDDFTHELCDPSLTDPTMGCMCDDGRGVCTVGLHVVHDGASSDLGAMRIENTRIEKCGQRGIKGKYCLHFHYAGICHGCAFRGNAIEFGQQRGIVVHETHAATVEANVLSDVRGAGIYIEDGNEMRNKIHYNVVICPWSLMHGGCTVPGTDNAQADTALNQAGLWSVTPGNDVVGNRFANSFNGMFYSFFGDKRVSGDGGGQLNTLFSSDMGRLEGNTFHGHGRFGTYILFYFPKRGCYSNILNNGFLDGGGHCEPFLATGETNGLSMHHVHNNVDYGNAFVGGYNVNDVQFRGHVAWDNLNNLYWKETANFADGCSAHISGGWFSNGNLALPDMAGFIIEDSVFTGGAQLETNHHCNVGVTGFLCMPTYILENVSWRSTASPWVTWHEEANHWGGIIVQAPLPKEHGSYGSHGYYRSPSFFPPGFQSLVSFYWTYLLDLPGCIKAQGAIYGGGILCEGPLRSLKIYSRGQTRANHDDLWLSVSDATTGRIITNFTIEYHQVGADASASAKQGYAFPVLADSRFIYDVSLIKGISGAPLPADWIVVFSEPVFGNRWLQPDEIILTVTGQPGCTKKRVTSQHDRRWLWADSDNYLFEGAWGRGACNDTAVAAAAAAADMGCKPALAKQPKKHYSVYLPDSCAGITCGAHGRCVGQYLGGTLAPTRGSCVCEQGWSGPTCASFPCANVTCSGRGVCEARNEMEYKCVCGADYAGADCEQSCVGFGCASDHAPFGCAWIATMQTLCLRGSGCYYSDHWIDIHDSSNMCCYGANCGACDLVDCSVVVVGGAPFGDCFVGPYCRSGSCVAAFARADGSACNGVPWGVCRGGVCLPPPKKTL